MQLVSQMTAPESESLKGYDLEISDHNVSVASEEFLKIIGRRRTVREFSDRQVPQSTIENCIQAANSAPSGANQQPWHFVAVSDQNKKSEIRLAAEAEEREFYERRAPEEWLDALAPIGTDAHKPFLETAPWLIAIFAESYSLDAQDQKSKNYYVSESVGIASGFLIAALNHCGLATLTHTPSPMKFLNELLSRPANERPFLLLVVGFPAENCQVPKLYKKSLPDVSTFIS